MLRQFGIMASIYVEKVMNIKNPPLALANVGVEDHKGGELQHEAFALLKKSPVNFIGNVEARDIPDDAADVIVSDGFTGKLHPENVRRRCPRDDGQAEGNLHKESEK